MNHLLRLKCHDQEGTSGKKKKTNSPMRSMASDESANSESYLEVEDYDSEDESSEELEEFDENGNLVVVQDEVDL